MRWLVLNAREGADVVNHYYKKARTSHLLRFACLQSASDNTLML